MERTGQDQLPSDKTMRLVGGTVPGASPFPGVPMPEPTASGDGDGVLHIDTGGPYEKIGPGGRTGWREDLAPGGSVVDRRMWPDRRNTVLPDDNDPARRPSEYSRKQKLDQSGLDRKRGVGRRLSDFTKSAEEGQMTKEQFLFLVAIENFKKANDRQFPTWTDILEVIRLLGYRKTMDSELNLANAEDWKEAPDAPPNVRAKGWEKRAG